MTLRISTGRQTVSGICGEDQLLGEGPVESVETFKPGKAVGFGSSCLVGVMSQPGFGKGRFRSGRFRVFIRASCDELLQSRPSGRRPGARWIAPNIDA